MSISPRTVFANLKKLDQVDPLTGAAYRQMAQDLLANSRVRLATRQAIADSLNQANYRLGLGTVDSDDSY
jgi:hypothetical protein